MNTLVLDIRKWRCGNHSNTIGNSLGYGNTRLMNSEGYMCCLGQFSPQLNTSINEEDLNGLTCPSELKKEIPLLTIPPYNVNSDFTTKAININDDVSTSVEEKIRDLTELSKMFGYELEIKSQ